MLKLVKIGKVVNMCMSVQPPWCSAFACAVVQIFPLSSSIAGWPRDWRAVNIMKPRL